MHELLPAQIPTVFVSNIRGTDDQEARARWCNDFGFALRANEADLADITKTVRELQDQEVRSRLKVKCAELPETNGGQEIADILQALTTQNTSEKAKNIVFYRLIAQDHLNRGLRHVANMGLRRVALVYRFINPHTVEQVAKQEPPVFGDSTESRELQKLIKSGTRFEHLITGASDEYRKKREEIAYAAYGDIVKTDN